MPIEEVVSPRSLKSASTHSNVSLLTGGFDRPYAYGLAMALVDKNVHLDVIGSDTIDSEEMHTTENLNFINLWPSVRGKSTRLVKLWRVVAHYRSLMTYVITAKPRLFHILWNSKIQLFDRTLLMLYYKAFGKKIALTAHNVNQDRRDSKDSWINRITLRIQYHLVDHIFVHTEKMREELIGDFGVAKNSVTVISYPINNAFPDTKLTPQEAKAKLGLSVSDKTILFSGKIKSYKGIEQLFAAFKLVIARDESYRLIVAGAVDKGLEGYMLSLEGTVAEEIAKRQIILEKRFIPDAEMEIYLKAADVLALPYSEIFQSGVLFLGYSFGLPVIATDVGSFREDVIEGETGYICRPGDAEDLARAIETYFSGDLYENLSRRRQDIKNYANANHSWDALARATCDIYAGLLGELKSESVGIDSHSRI